MEDGPFEHEASGLAGVQVEDLNANQRLGLLGTLAAVGNIGAVIITYTILGGSLIIIVV